MKKVLLVALMAVAGLAQAEPTAAKKELIDKVLKLHQPAITAVATQLVERPAAIMMQQINPAIQFRVPSEKREALVKDIQGDVKKYADETAPLLRERALKLAPSTIGVVLDEKFSEALAGRKPVILRIPDDYQFMDAELVELLRTELSAHLQL